MMANTLIALLLAYVLHLNVIGPFVILRTLKIPARPRFDEIDEEAHLAASGENYKALSLELESLGFRRVGSSVFADSHNVSNFTLFTNQGDETVAMLVTMHSSQRHFTYAEFSQLYSDGSMLDVSNAPVASPYPRMKLKMAARFPEVNDTATLYEILLKLKKQLSNTARPVPYDAAQGFRPVEAFMERECDELVRLGYCRPEIDRDGRRSLALKGAFLLTWKSVFPANKIVDYLDRKHSRDLLKRA